MAKSKSSKSALSNRYANALFSLASEEKKIDIVEKELSNIVEMIQSSPDLQSAIASPIISKNILLVAFLEILKKVNISKLTTQFCITLGNNGRLALLSDVNVAFSKLLSESRGELVAEITSAKPLTKEQLNNISSSLGRVTGKKITIKEKVEKKILGGMIVKIGSLMLDDSVDGKLERMKLHLKNANVG